MAAAARDATDTRTELMAMVARLIQEYAELPAGTVIRCAARARRDILDAATHPAVLDAIELSTRSRLTSMLTSHPES